MPDVVSLAICHLRRFARKRQWCLPILIITLLIAGLGAWGKITLPGSMLAMASLSLAAFALQAIRDRDLGFGAGLLSAGVPTVQVYLSRVLAAAVLFITLCVLRSALFYFL